MPVVVVPVIDPEDIADQAEGEEDDLEHGGLQAGR
jgi:hypothetical protein